MKQTGVTVTPEVAVMSADQKLLYRGRIDDRYVEFGKDRPEPTVRDLERALDAILAGKPVPVRETQAVGCYPFGSDQMTCVWRATALAVAVSVASLIATAQAVALQTSTEVTFTRDIAPIVFNSCASCHRQGGPGPFRSDHL